MYYGLQEMINVYRKITHDAFHSRNNWSSGRVNLVLMNIMEVIKVRLFIEVMFEKCYFCFNDEAINCCPIDQIVGIL